VDTSLYIQGFIIGLTLAVPVGPISLLCIQRTIAEGRLHGILSGLGVTTADSFYAAVAFLGLTAISGLIISHQLFFRLLAGLILVLVGIRIWMSKPVRIEANPVHEPYYKDYLSMLAITLANPLTIIFFIAILPGFGFVINGSTLLSGFVFVGGVFSGSAVWWLVLCGSIGSVRSRISAGNLTTVNRISGVLIALFGTGMLLLLLMPDLLPISL
jgi:threonine/homoserine/homoserine lactone efflux protein